VIVVCGSSDSIKRGATSSHPQVVGNDKDRKQSQRLPLFFFVAYELWMRV